MDNSTKTSHTHHSAPNSHRWQVAIPVIALLAMIIYLVMPGEEAVKPFNMETPPDELAHTPGEASTPTYEAVKNSWEADLLAKAKQQEDKTVIAPPPGWTKAKKAKEVQLASVEDTFTPLFENTENDKANAKASASPQPTHADTKDIDDQHDTSMLQANISQAPFGPLFEPDRVISELTTKDDTTVLSGNNKGDHAADDRNTQANDTTARDVSEETLTRKITALNALQTQLNNRHHQVAGHQSVNLARAETAGVKTAQGNTAKGKTTIEVISPGDMFLCQMDMETNSALPKRVLASCLNGPIAKATITGSFEQHEDMLTFQFNTLTINKRTIEIEAFAVDPDTYSPGLSSDVDYHYVQRTAGLFASAFLEGLGQVPLFSGTIHSTPTTTVVEQKYDAKDRVAAGLGKIGERTAPKAEALWNKKPTVKEHRGEVFGLVFTKPILQENFPANASMTDYDG